MPSLAIFAVAGLLAPQAPTHAEAWDCKITADREWLMIDKRRGEIITYSFGYRAGHQGRCVRLV